MQSWKSRVRDHQRSCWAREGPITLSLITPLRKTSPSTSILPRERQHPNSENEIGVWIGIYIYVYCLTRVFVPKSRFINFFCFGQLLVAVLSSYRYEGPKVSEEMAKLEAKALLEAVKGGAPLENDEVVRILSTRSKLHLKLVYNHYNELTTKYLDQVSNFIFFILS